jgi:hypothetical protein
MRTCTAVVVILLAVLVGCKKRDKGNERTLEEALGLTPEGPRAGKELLLPPPPATYPDTVGGKLARALDESAALVDQGYKAPKRWDARLLELANTLPTEAVGGGAPRGLDATADRKLVEEAFSRFWRSANKFPDHVWERVVHEYGLMYVQQNLGSYELGRRRCAEHHPDGIPKKGRITEPSDQVIDGHHVEVNVTNGTRAKWTRAGGFTLSGSVQFREALEVHITTPFSVAVQLRGEAGELRVRPAWALPVDLVGLKTNSVVLEGGIGGIGGTMFRVGPDVANVHYNRAGYCGLLLIRDNPKLTVSQGQPVFPSKDALTLTVIRY